MLTHEEEEEEEKTESAFRRVLVRVIQCLCTRWTLADHRMAFDAGLVRVQARGISVCPCVCACVCMV